MLSLAIMITAFSCSRGKEPTIAAKHVTWITSEYNLMHFLKKIIFGQPCLNTTCHMWPFSPPSLSPYGHPHALEGVYGERVDGIHSPETLITTFVILCVSQ
jgi:hypothetical protein